MRSFNDDYCQRNLSLCLSLGIFLIVLLIVVLFILYQYFSRREKQINRSIRPKENFNENQSMNGKKINRSVEELLRQTPQMIGTPVTFHQFNRITFL